MKIFDYNDIQLIPNKCIVSSRRECDTSVMFGGRKFKLPVVPSNMASIITEELCIELANLGYFYIMHRFNVDNLKFIKKMHDLNLYASISIGIKDDDFKFIDLLKEKNIAPEYITIDIAHGHNSKVKELIYKIKDHFKDKIFVVAGNVGTPLAIRDLQRWGADSIKVGIGPGKVCITKIKTGFGTGGWQLSALYWCFKAANVPLIADGGIRVNGDIAKSIRFGATLCMIGSMFAAHEESPGKLEIFDDIKYKQYYGSASEYNKKEKRYIEGKLELIKLRGSIFTTLQHMQEDLQSAISYSGGKELLSLRRVDYVILQDSDYF